jgi:hypothetical protein
MLKGLIHRSDLEYYTLFREVNDLYWKYGDEQVRWARGQALGLGPSFPLFTLAHGFLLFALNGFKWRSEFYVLGDDVVIMDDELALKYEEALRELDMPFSAAKTLRSSRMAEFAGYLFTPKGKFQIPKWKALRDDNILDLVRTWGPEAVDFLHPSDQPFVRWFASIPEPIGFGWNPHGLPLADRVAGLEEFLWPEPELVGDLWTDPFNVINRRLEYMSPWIRYSMRDFAKRAQDAITTLEQRVVEVVNESLPSYLSPWAKVLGKNLRSIGVSALPMAQPTRFTWKGSIPPLHRVKAAYWDHYVTHQRISSVG